MALLDVRQWWLRPVPVSIAYRFWKARPSTDGGSKRSKRTPQRRPLSILIAFAFTQRDYSSSCCEAKTPMWERRYWVPCAPSCRTATTPVARLGIDLSSAAYLPLWRKDEPKLSIWRAHITPLETA